MTCVACSAAGGTASAPAATEAAVAPVEKSSTTSASSSSSSDAGLINSEVRSIESVRVPAAACNTDDQLHLLDDDAKEDVPIELTRSLDQALGAFDTELDISVSIWVDGYGEVAALEPDLALLPASNQKLITAIGVAELLPLDDRFTTEIFADGDDLALIAGGDPTLTRAGLADLAAQVAAAGVSAVATLRIDATRYTGGVAAPGWQNWQLPQYVGPLSAFMVDNNRYRSDPAFVDDPALGNAETFVESLSAVGVSVDRIEVVDSSVVTTPQASLVAAVESAPFAALVAQLLLDSDNQHADQLVQEIGARLGDGSIESGNSSIDRALSEWCLDLDGDSGDGSGLSRANFRSAREFRRILTSAREESWGPWLEASLPVGGGSGTLRGRFVGTAAERRIRAKTGTIIGGIALSGYATTVGERAVVFSILVNGDPTLVRNSRPAMDALLAEVVGWTG